MRTSVLDSPDIGKRAAEIAEERSRNIALCNCKRPDGVGELDRSACPIHRDPPTRHEGCCLAPLQQQPQRGAWDGRRTVIRQAQSPEVKFLQRLHLRIDRARPRVISDAEFVDLLLQPLANTGWKP